jgi:ribulose-phosphate 3-epimerase
MKANKNHVKLAPSILSADFAHLGNQIEEVTEAGADYIHVDVMDGHFVPNITIGPPVIASIRSCTNLPLDVHLMIENPGQYISQFASSGADIITVHVEACTHIHREIQLIKQSGLKAGVSLNPGTPLDFIVDILSQIDLVLIMSVDPGFGGQSFIPEIFSKISNLRSIINDNKINVEIEVDGGININNALKVVNAGADILAIGTAIFKTEGGITQALRSFRQAVN